MKDLYGVAHHVEVQASTLFEAGAAAIAASSAVLPLADDVPLKAFERWLGTPSVSPSHQTGGSMAPSGMPPTARRNVPSDTERVVVR